MAKIEEAFFNTLKGGNPYLPKLGVDDVSRLSDDDVIDCGGFLMTKGFLIALRDHPDIKIRVRSSKKEKTNERRGRSPRLLSG